MSGPDLASAFRCLAAAVLAQAFDDLQASENAVSQATRSNAEWFFRSEHYQVFADIAGVAHGVVMAKYREVMMEQQKGAEYAGIQS